MPKITIAIDGFSSTGKSTIARQLGEWLGYLYVDTGAMYRAITLFAMRNDFISENHFEPEKLIATLPEIRISFKKTKTLGPAEVYLNDENVEKQIRTLMVSEFVSPIATI
jgi:cytidylate kinase